MPVPQSDVGQRAYNDDRAHVFHSWSAQAELDPIVMESAHGSYIVDADKKEYIDFSSQLVYTNIGHQHPKVVQAIKEQADQLCTIAPAYANDKRSEAARLITSHLPDHLNKVLFTNGGADAVEHAIRLARLHTGRYKVLSRFRGYHGATQIAMNISGDNRRWRNDYGTSGAVHFFGPFLYRSQFHATTEEDECQRALEYLDNLIAFEGPELFAALIMESIPGTAGIMPPPAGYWQGVREICDKYGIVMICDEVMAGFGRTGNWFAFEEFGAKPDLVTFAKGVNSGYVPLGGIAISDEIAADFDHTPYPGGLTYSGHVLATSAAVATINAMDEEGMVDNARRLGEDVFGPALRDLAAKHHSIGDIRGLGCFWAVELVKDQETREPLGAYGTTAPEVKELVAECRENGLIVFQNMNRIHICPALNIPDDVARQGLEILDKALTTLDQKVAIQ